MKSQKLPLEFKIAADILNLHRFNKDVEWDLNAVFGSAVQGEIHRRVRSLHPAKLGVIVAQGVVSGHEAVRRALVECQSLDGRDCMELWGKATIRGAIMKLLMDNNDRIRTSRSPG